jgi:adenosylcobinamide amidohydrolase
MAVLNFRWMENDIVNQTLPQASLREDTLIVSFPGICRTVSWAPLGGGLTMARHWINHQVQESRTLQEDMESPAKTLRRVGRKLDLSGNLVGQMTSGNIKAFQESVLTDKGWTVFTVGTAGFSNAVRVGETASNDSQKVGTINLLVWISEPLALPTLFEILQIAVEARTLAIMELGMKSRATGAPATGTGTDCLTVACPSGKGRRVYAGKHTVLGELVGKTVLNVMDQKGKDK